jgi:hypothetical protein
MMDPGTGEGTAGWSGSASLREIVMEKELRRAIPPAIVMVAAIVAAFVFTAGRNDTKIASNDQPVPGSSGIAHPHPPLDRAPGEVLRIPL